MKHGYEVDNGRPQFPIRVQSVAKKNLLDGNLYPSCVPIGRCCRSVFVPKRIQTEVVNSPEICKCQSKILLQAKLPLVNIRAHSGTESASIP
jgi:hypothetical protein